MKIKIEYGYDSDDIPFKACTWLDGRYFVVFSSKSYEDAKYRLMEKVAINIVSTRLVPPSEEVDI